MRHAVTLALLLLPLPIGALAACGGDDGKPTTADTARPGVVCEEAADCGGIRLLPCQTVTCDQAVKRCVVGAEPDGAACATGNACRSAETCHAGTCGGGTIAPADCGAHDCGVDRCGNTCGTCGAGFFCNDASLCEAEPPDPCEGITFDGCCTGNGSARWCQDGVLQEVNCPEAAAADQVDGPNCAYTGADTGYYCVSGPEVAATDPFLPYLCPGASCGPAPCGDRECGVKCGVVCGTCAGGAICNADGQCETDNCGDLTFVGCCDGDVSVWCEDNVVKRQSCASGTPGTCGWNGAESYYDCAQPAGGDPSGAHPLACDDLTIPGAAP
ncbi:MAG: hypothetical protein KC635_02840 [Myxococcales bacterium]|nr:hypothetical protein [Myxococcales bacterium]